ncbi:MAG: tRNA (adenosine(37)-N6)-threonylcarbamoyltransferase complex dimerization subunit type 1 TsaB [Phycisphaerae bacterium]|nr:tRNA (adenosine(37)-N6)-threonylcarbamoyltransferase complex dimerization subunit type 1 TsaB [Phycisphaerae bacterium]
MEKQKNILTIETSGQIGSVAISQGDQILAHTQFSGVMKHTTELLPSIDKLTSDIGWKPADIDYIYVSAGPGSFTGLRLAVTTAKTLAYANNCRIVPVPSIDAQVLNADIAIADGFTDIKNVAVVLHAGRDMVFGGIYEKSENTDGFISGYKTISQPTMIDVEEFLAKAPKPLYVLGLGIKYHKDKFESSEAILLDEKYWSPQVKFVHSCGHLRAAANQFAGNDAFDDAVKFEPQYMRRPEAEVKWEELGRK